MFRRAALTALTILSPAAVHAQTAGEPATARELLDGYIAQALRANLTIAQREAAEARATHATREARGRYLPSVGVDARYSEFSGVVNIGDFINPANAALNQLIGQQRFPTDINATLPFRQETRLQLVQPVFNPAIRAAHSAARANESLRRDETRATRRQVAADIQIAWLGVASTAQVVRTIESSLAVLNENVRVAERLVAAGHSTPDAVLRARSERSDIMQQLAEAVRQHDAAKRGFNLLLDRDANAPIDIADDETLISSPIADLAQLQERALAKREEMAQVNSGLQLADAGGKLARASFLPAMSIAASYGVQGAQYRFDRNNDVALASVVLSWNLFNGGQDLARREQAQLQREETLLRRRELERAIRMQVANAHEALEVSRVSMQSANDRYDLAKRAFELIERRYAEAMATHVEYLAARAAYTNAALNQVITRYAFAARYVELERAAALLDLPGDA